MSTTITTTTTSGSESRLWIAVPGVAFGGIGIEMLLASLGFPHAVWGGVAGCVIASCILFYQAYTKPRRDIVSLFVPVYAFFIFIVPNEISSGVIVQTFYAATITLLSVRVEKLFNVPKQEKRTMKQTLNDYIARIEPIIAEIDEETGHLVAQALLMYQFGLHLNAAHKSKEALARIDSETPHSGALKTALLIFQERATDLAESRTTRKPEYAFSEEDRDLLAIPLSPDEVEDPTKLDFDNALILIYAVGIETSPEDEEALAEHQDSIIRILESYKDALAA
jgi:hypothetical protein